MTKTSTSAASEAASFRRKLGPWYRKNGRHELPWRLTRNAYAVLVSEVMLQQTQVERVIPYYRAWLQRWPDFAVLASVPASEVIRAWRGLGYNRRALNLHRLAGLVVETYGGNLPNDARELLNLPGVGSYTASAVRCFARGERVAVADTNIARVLARAVLGAASQRDVPPGRIREAAAALVPVRNARDHNLGLMDLGAMICQARVPHCEACPVRTLCRWNTAGRPDETKRSPSLPKFETTARYARGRIIDALREHPASESELASRLPEYHRPHIQQYLQGLARDGLAFETAEGWLLPES